MDLITFNLIIRVGLQDDELPIHDFASANTNCDGGVCLRTSNHQELCRIAALNFVIHYVYPRYKSDAYIYCYLISGAYFILFINSHIFTLLKKIKIY